MRLPLKQRIGWTSRKVASVGQILQCGRAAASEFKRMCNPLPFLA